MFLLHPFVLSLLVMTMKSIGLETMRFVDITGQVLSLNIFNWIVSFQRNNLISSGGGCWFCSFPFHNLVVFFNETTRSRQAKSNKRIPLKGQYLGIGDWLPKSPGPNVSSLSK